MKIELQCPFFVSTRWLINGVPQWIWAEESEVGFLYDGKVYVTQYVSNSGYGGAIRIYEIGENVESFPKGGLYAALELRKKGLGRMIASCDDSHARPREWGLRDGGTIREKQTFWQTEWYFDERFVMRWFLNYRRPFRWFRFSFSEAEITANDEIVPILLGILASPV